jgi:hypothetical protein
MRADSPTAEAHVSRIEQLGVERWRRKSFGSQSSLQIQANGNSMRINYSPSEASGSIRHLSIELARK